MFWCEVRPGTYFSRQPRVALASGWESPPAGRPVASPAALQGRLPSSAAFLTRLMLGPRQCITLSLRVLLRDLIGTEGEKQLENIYFSFI